MAWGWSWRPYVPVHKRRAQAAREMAKLRKKGVSIQPVTIAGRQIARTFWGRAWCAHLEKFSDYENRLPRGRTYVRNGSVCHLEIRRGKIVAKVSGSDIYDVSIDIKALAKTRWKRVRQSCAGQVASLLELLQGKLSEHVMSVVTDRDQGLFPTPSEISMHCSCPDWAGMCKHVAAAMYGVGARLDENPELLFVLRGVDYNELITTATAKSVIGKKARTARRTLDEQSIGEVFGIEVTPPTEATKVAAQHRRARGNGLSCPTSQRKRRVRTTDPTVIPGATRRAGTRRKQPSQA